MRFELACMPSTRRQMLVPVGASLLGVAGCLGLGDPNLVINNELNQRVTVNIDITRVSDMRVVMRTDRSLGAEKTATLLYPLDEPGEYRIQITAQEANIGGETTVFVDESAAIPMECRSKPDNTHPTIVLGVVCALPVLTTVWGVASPQFSELRLKPNRCPPTKRQPRPRS